MSVKIFFVYESQLHHVRYLKTVDIDIKYSTGHTNGSVYGLPAKLKNSITPVQNLYFGGTDQGFLGIVGATLGGILMSNLHILRKKKSHQTHKPRKIINHGAKLAKGSKISL